MDPYREDAELRIRTAEERARRAERRAIDLERQAAPARWHTVRVAACASFVAFLGFLGTMCTYRDSLGVYKQAVEVCASVRGVDCDYEIDRVRACPDVTPSDYTCVPHRDGYHCTQNVPHVDLDIDSPAECTTQVINGFCCTSTGDKRFSCARDDEVFDCVCDGTCACVREGVR